MNREFSPLGAVLVMGACVFVAEFIVMLIMPLLGTLSTSADALVDAFLLVLFLAPPFYFLILKHPMYTAPLAGFEKIPSPAKALGVLTTVIFISEVAIMVVLDALPPLPLLAEALLDSCFLLVLIGPSLYYFLFLPLVKGIASLKEAERRLQRSNVDLEEKVEERTKDLREANTELEEEIAEREKAEKALRMEKERAQKYLDMAGVLFVVLDTAGNISMINAKGCAILGCAAENINGRNWFDTFIPEEERGKAKEGFQRLFAGKGGGSPYFEGAIITREGEKRFIGWHATRLNGSAGKADTLLLAGEDITTMKLEAETQRRTEKLASIGTLASGVAHEILNPLNIISAIAQLMLLDQREGESGRNAKEILEQVRRATKITDSLRMFAHPKSEEISCLKINDVIDQSLLLIEHDLKLDNIAVVRDYQPDVPDVEGDEDKLMQIFINLATNAHHALLGRQGAEIAISTRGINDGVEVRFCDNGAGIPPEHISRIFDPFFTTKDPNRGTGLGLSVVHTIIHNHFGSIHVESQLEKGTCFTIRLPCWRAVAKAGLAPPPPAPAA